MAVQQVSPQSDGNTVPSRPSRQSLVPFLTALCFYVFYSSTAASASSNLPTEYFAKVRIKACSQLLEGRASLELSYRLGGVGPRHAITLLRKDMNMARGEVIAHFMLPRTHGQQKMHIEAFCRNGSQVSRASNQIAVSNCDFLAQYDTDGDGLLDSQEDSNCDNFFSPGDRSNLHNVDTDGDGVRDLVEVLEGYDPTNPGSSPRPYIVSSARFDPDGDQNSNPVIWRPWNGMWYIRDFTRQGLHLGLQFGLPGDTPITYQPKDRTSNVGVVRRSGNDLLWFLNGTGLGFDDGHYENVRKFGLFGDNLIPGPWQRPGETNLAVARLFNDHWTFYILQTDGSVRQVVWGGNGDIPKVQDYDGDGIFDIAVFRPSNATYYVIRSSDGLASVVEFGSGTAEHSVRGDIDGDGKDDFITWEPRDGMFKSLSEERTGRYTQEASLQLGLYFVHLPLSWNTQGGKTLFTVVDHRSGMRYVRPDNDPHAPPIGLQWGLAGDSQG